MAVMKTAFWKTIYTAGHDAAALLQAESGWRLQGSAVYLLDGAPASIRYSLDLDADWSTRRGCFEGFVGQEAIHRDIVRDRDGWLLDGVRQPGLDDVVDLDFGFTPATNHPQLRRMALEIGQRKEIVVAWLDVDSDGLAPLPQIYRRTADRCYDYDSPQGSYRATLQIAGNGFVSVYPDLWEMEGEKG